MFCQRCGAKIQSGAKFCANCGAATNAANNQQSYGGQSGYTYDRQSEIEKTDIGKESLTEKKKKYTVLIGAIAGVLVLALLLFVLVMILGDRKESEQEQPVENNQIEEQEEVVPEVTQPSEPVVAQPSEPAVAQPVEPAVAQPVEPETAPPVVTYEYRYEIIQSDMSWSEAKEACEARGGYLATITTSEEYEKISKLADETDLIYLWLGACLPTADASWSQAGWITGESWSFENWYPGEPSKWDDDGALEYCLSMWKVKGGPWTFNDQRNDIVAALPSITGKVGYVCEYKIEVAG